MSDAGGRWAHPRHVGAGPGCGGDGGTNPLKVGQDGDDAQRAGRGRRAAFRCPARKLVGLIDELRLMILERDDAMAIEEVLDDLASFAGCEFAEQEALMRSSGAPDWQAHKRRHDEMASRLGSLQKRFEYEPDAVEREELYDCLSDWLGHVLREDLGACTFGIVEAELIRAPFLDESWRSRING